MLDESYRLTRALGRAAGALVVVSHVRGTGAWHEVIWAHETVQHAVQGWTPPRYADGEAIVERVLQEGVERSEPLAGMVGLDARQREQLARRVPEGAWLGLSRTAVGPMVCWLGFEERPSQERLSGAADLVVASCCEGTCPYRRYLDAIPGVFLAVAPDGTVRATNSYISRLGYDAGDVGRLNVADLFGVGDWARLERALKTSGHARGLHVLMRHRTGELVAMDMLAVARSEERGPDHDVLTLGCDLRSERQLGNMRRLEAVDRVVSGVAHELNNPLQTVVGNAEMLTGMKLPDSARRRAQRVLGGATRCREVVNGLLKLKRGRQDLAVPVDLEDVARRALARLKDELSLPVSTRVESDPDLPQVEGNASELEQAVEHLLRNAFQAVARAEAPQVEIALSASAQLVQMVIADNGPGMEMEVLERAFEPFFTTRGVGAGKGLGLSISLGIIEEHGGYLELLPGAEGLRVLVTLPVSGHRPY